MKEAAVEKVMDRKKVASAIHSILDSGVALLTKKKLENDDFSKIKLIRVMGAHVNAGVAMVQQETAQQKIQVIRERMQQLGFGGEPKRLAE